MPNIQEQRNHKTRTHSRLAPRSSRKVLHRREGSLRQAPFALARAQKEEQWWHRVLSLRRDLLTWARWLVAQD